MEWLQTKNIKDLGRLKPKKAKKINLRRVVIDHHKREITELAEQMSGAKPGSKAYLGVYSVALGEIMEKLTDEQMESYRREAEERQNTSLTGEEKCR